MKFNFEDASVNVVDGVLKYPKTATGAAAFVFGMMVSAFFMAEWAVFWISVGLCVLSVVAAYFAGKPKAPK